MRPSSASPLANCVPSHDLEAIAPELKRHDMDRQAVSEFARAFSSYRDRDGKERVCDGITNSTLPVSDGRQCAGDGRNGPGKCAEDDTRFLKELLGKFSPRTAALLVDLETGHVREVISWLARHSGFSCVDECIAWLSKQMDASPEEVCHWAVQAGGLFDLRHSRSPNDGEEGCLHRQEVGDLGQRHHICYILSWSSVFSNLEVMAPPTP